MSRVEKGHLPDLANSSRRSFERPPRAYGSTPAAIHASLHTDQHLSEQAADQIAEIVTQLYTQRAIHVGDAAVGATECETVRLPALARHAWAARKWEAAVELIVDTTTADAKILVPMPIKPGGSVGPPPESSWTLTATPS